MKRYRGKTFRKRPEPMIYVRKLGAEMMRGEWRISDSTTLVVDVGRNCNLATFRNGQHRIRALAEEALKGFEELT